MKPNFAILRTSKLKTFGNVGASLDHSYRERETLNADPALSGDNEHSHENADKAMKALRDRIPEKRRKDAVLGIEYFIGASPEWFAGGGQGTDSYFRDALAWLEKRHGKENVVAWSIHRDEKTPHMVAYVVPRDGEKLNAKKWLGGAAALSRMQSEFASDVAARHGLERGIEGSKAKHQTVKEWYGQIERRPATPRIEPEDLKPKKFKEGQGLLGRLGLVEESAFGVSERINAKLEEQAAPLAANASVTVSERRRASEMAKTAFTLTQEKKTLQNELDAIKKHLAPVLELATLDRNEFVQTILRAQERVFQLTPKQGRQQREKDRGWSR